MAEQHKLATSSDALIPSRRIGLRGKAMIALSLTCLLALGPTLLIGWSVVDNVRDHFGIAFARNYTQLHSQKIFAPVSRDLALSMRLADSEVLRNWLKNETGIEQRSLFFREAEGYARAFRGRSFFVIADASRHYYFKDEGTSDATIPRYTLDPENKNDAWYFSTMRDTESFNINVSRDVNLNVTKVWLNVLVKDGDRKIGLTGSGLDLSKFLEEFVVSKETGVTPMVTDIQGALLAHPDTRLISYDSIGAGTGQHNVSGLLDDDDSRISLNTARRQAEQSPGEVQTIWVQMGGKRQLLALTFIPELQWHILSAIDLSAARVVEFGWFTPIVVLLALLLAILLLSFGYATERLILQPLRRLHSSARAIACGQYQVALPVGRQDEIGELSNAFSIMAGKVRSHLDELENRVRERTSELESAHRQVAYAYRQINESIGYAFHLQHAILPDQQLKQWFDGNCFVLWKPRDVVGGDFYTFRSQGECCLLGLFDCAGHGVPGAMMTMLMSTTMDSAIATLGIDDPAALLAYADTASRIKLAESSPSAAVAPDTDAAMLFIDRAAGLLRFAGAKISLFVYDGLEVREIKGVRRPLGGKRVGQFVNVELPIHRSHTYYLVTDGFLDQAVGERGFGFGKSRFADMLRRHAGLTLAEQQHAFAETLAAHQGGRPQRDDITLLSFCFQQQPLSNEEPA